MLMFDFDDAVHLFRTNKGLRFSVAARQHADRSTPHFYVARGSRRNQFHRIFSDKESILAPNSIDILSARPRQRPQPRAGPGTKDRKKTVRKQQQKKKKKKKKKKRTKGALPKKTKETDPSNPRPTHVTAEDHRLLKLHLTKSLTVGSIHANMRRMNTILDGESKFHSETLWLTVVIQNRIQMHMFEAIALDIFQLIASWDTTTDDVQRKADIQDILDNKAFYFALDTLFCSGQQGRQSQAARAMNAPTRTIGTRNRPIVSPAAPQPQPQPQPQSAAAHAQNAFDSYKAFTGFVPFRQQQQGFFPSTVSRLVALAVYNAVRAHYYGAKFPEDAERPDGVNAIDFFFEKNAQHREFADFAKVKFAHGFVFLLEADLAHIFFPDAETKPIISRELGAIISSAAETEVVSKKTVLIEKLLYRLDPVKRFDGFCEKASFQSDRRRRTKFKLRGTIYTNGFVLHLLAHDTTATRRRTTSLPHQSSKGDDDEDNEDGDEALFRDFNEDCELDDAFLESGGTIQIQQSAGLVAAGDSGKRKPIRGVSPESESSKRQRFSTPQPLPAGQDVATSSSIPTPTASPTSSLGTIEISKAPSTGSEDQRCWKMWTCVSAHQMFVRQQIPWSLVSTQARFTP
ncbi:hypothetical protein BGZ58_010617 [Dissophora ornata]|nr:hypothetical protein BGZ58_010617 [Dissophora ornata]